MKKLKLFKKLKPNKPYTFEEYLMEVFAQDYHGTDDDMPNEYEKWVSELDTQELIDYAERLIAELQADEEEDDDEDEWGTELSEDEAEELGLPTGNDEDEKNMSHLGPEQ